MKMKTQPIEFEKALYSLIKPHQYRDWMQAPFTIGGDVYATDAYTIMKVPKHCVRSFGECDERKVPFVLNIFDFTPEKIMTIKVQDLKKAIDKIPLVDEVLDETIEEECTECGGTGEVEWEYGYYTKEDDCPICYGDGILEEDKKKKTGKKVKDHSYFIDFNFSRIRCRMIEELINIAYLLKSDEVEVIHQTAPNKGIGFQVGIAQVIMMPALQSHEDNIIHRFES